MLAISLLLAWRHKFAKENYKSEKVKRGSKGALDRCPRVN
jgi:hypothetical protein